MKEEKFWIAVEKKTGEAVIVLAVNASECRIDLRPEVHQYDPPTSEGMNEGFDSLWRAMGLDPAEHRAHVFGHAELIIQSRFNREFDLVAQAIKERCGCEEGGKDGNPSQD